ncbi:MAG: fasciclin domain-containing protein [Ignavibacteria bacterium]|nr:fasciclin domain-containing protein [Ignavibacteria bacterium]
MTKFFAIILVALTLIIPSNKVFAGGDKPQNIVEIAISNGSFTTLVEALKIAGLVDALLGDGPFTVFAPTDEAFAKVPAETLEALLNDKEALTKVLLYHVVSGNVTSGAVVNLKSAETLEGSSVKIKVEDGEVYIDGAKVIAVDVMGTNGVIHVIDSVILPPSLR